METLATMGTPLLLLSCSDFFPFKKQGGMVVVGGAGGEGLCVYPSSKEGGPGGKGQPSHSSQQRWIALLHAAKRAALRSSHHKTKTMATTEGDRGQLASGAHHFTTYTNVES